ncbi:MAG: hypothetical protein ABJC74_12425 [Gemmatimonadota bacterium]
MSLQHRISTLGLLVLSACGKVSAEGGNDSQLFGDRTSVSRTARILPAGTRIDATLNQAITSHSHKAGQMALATVTTDVRRYNGRVVIPAGSIFELKITRLEPGAGGDGVLTFAASYALIRGSRYPVKAEVVSVVHSMAGGEVVAGVGAATEIRLTGELVVAK